MASDLYGVICRSGKASEFTKELCQLQEIEDVLWQYVTDPRNKASGGRT